MDFCLLLKTRVEILSKIWEKNLSSKNIVKKLLLKTTSERAIQNTVETTGNLIGSKIADKITRVSRNSQNNSETKEEIYIAPDLRHKIIDDLRLI